MNDLGKTLTFPVLVVTTPLERNGVPSIYHASKFNLCFPLSHILLHKNYGWSSKWGADFLAEPVCSGSPDLHAEPACPFTSSCRHPGSVGSSWKPQSSWEVASCALFVQMKCLGCKNHLGVPCLPSPLLNNK